MTTLSFASDKEGFGFGVFVISSLRKLGWTHPVIATLDISLLRKEGVGVHESSFLRIFTILDFFPLFAPPLYSSKEEAGGESTLADSFQQDILVTNNQQLNRPLDQF